MNYYIQDYYMNSWISLKELGGLDSVKVTSPGERDSCSGVLLW